MATDIKQDKQRKPYTIERGGKNNPHWKGGKPHCLDCNKEIWYEMKRCKPCETTRRWKLNLMPEMKPNKTSFKRGEHYSIGTEFQKGLTPWNKGKPFLQIRKESHWNWQGGITSINHALRHSFEYEEWRKLVLERDDYTCQQCGQIGEYLEVDHIKPFSKYPELRFELSNGRTLCHDCHVKTDTYAGRVRRIYATR